MNSKKIAIDIIGLRGFPAQFSGSSGIDTYIEKMLTESTLQNSFKFHLYIISHYKSETINRNKNANLSLKKIYSFKSKYFEAILYSLIASIQAFFSSSKIVWYQGSGPAFFAFIPKLAGKKIVLTLHGKDWERKKWNFLAQQIFQFMTLLALVLADEITSVSKKDAKEIELIINRRITFSPPGYTAYTTTIRKRKYISYLGRIVPEKRIEWLLAAFLENELYKSHTLLIAGDFGLDYNYYRQLRLTYKHKSIKWLGYIAGKQKRNLLMTSSIFVSASEIEGFSLSLLEALSYRNVCLISDTVIEEELKEISLIKTYNKNDYSDFSKKLKSVTLLKKKNGEEVKIEGLSWKKTGHVFKSVFLNLEYKNQT